MRYFFAKSVANRLFAGVQFIPVGPHAGGITGVFSTEDDGLASRLAVDTSVEEIDEGTFLKKKHQLSSPSQRTEAYASRSHLSLRPDQAAAVVVAGDSRPVHALPETIADALTVRPIPV